MIKKNNKLSIWSSPDIKEHKVITNVYDHPRAARRGNATFTEVKRWENGTESDDVYITDVQNTYRDVDQNLYITSQSLPNYSKERISLSDETVVLGQDFIISEEVNITNPNNLDKILNIGRHSFITGDAVYYQSGLPGNSLNIPNCLLLF